MLSRKDILANKASVSSPASGLPVFERRILCPSTRLSHTSLHLGGGVLYSMKGHIVLLVVCVKHKMIYLNTQLIADASLKKRRLLKAIYAASSMAWDSWVCTDAAQDKGLTCKEWPCRAWWVASRL